ncbi:MAG: hypothetical protein WCO84_06880, partial [bacterium]
TQLSSGVSTEGGSNVSDRNPIEIRSAFNVARQQGLTLSELVGQFGISKSTASLWAQEVVPTPGGELRLQGKQGGGLAKMLAYVQGPDSPRARKCASAREKTFLEGFNSNPSLEDALCAGLYLGEGTKCHYGNCAPSWGFTNSDSELVRHMIEWAIRAGQPPEGFRAYVGVHPEDILTEDDVKDHWSSVGIPRNKIKITRGRSPTSSSKSKRRIPFGTCSLRPVGNGVRLYAYYQGQLAFLAP